MAITLIPRRAIAPNMRAATPGTPRIPDPTTATIATSRSASTRRAARVRSRADSSAEEAMTPGPRTIRPSARLDAMVTRMRHQNLTSLPVTHSDGVLVGLLRREDAEARSDPPVGS